MSDGGKGSKPRPYSVDAETFANNWDAIFKKSKISDKVVEQVQENIDKDVKEFQEREQK